jgi:COP9 signalosome complex subunit 12
MDQLAQDLSKAYGSFNGYHVAELLRPDPVGDNLERLRIIVRSSNHATVKKDVNVSLRTTDLARQPNSTLTGWSEIVQAYWRAIAEIVHMLDPEEVKREVGLAQHHLIADAVANLSQPPTWTRVYELWREVTSQIIRGFSNYDFGNWLIPTLYVAGRHLRFFALKADDERALNPVQEKGLSFADDFDPETEKHGQLRDCEQQLKRIFTLCLTDRAPLETSRKWGIYYIINLLFKTYFKLRSPSLSKTILKAISAYQGDMPPLGAFPKSQQVTFLYYAGVLAFLEENYVEAEERLTEAWNLCRKDSIRNQEYSHLPIPVSYFLRHASDATTGEFSPT